MREAKVYDLDELGSQTALHHARRYIGDISGSSIPLEEEDIDNHLREIPETVLESDVLNSADSYIITYRRSEPGPDIEAEIVEFYDLGDRIVVSGEGDYLRNVEEIIESENPASKASREKFDHKVKEGLKGVKARLGG